MSLCVGRVAAEDMGSAELAEGAGQDQVPNEVLVEGNIVYANGISILVKKAEDGKAYLYDAEGTQKLSDTVIGSGTTIFGGGKNTDVEGGTNVVVDDVAVSQIYGGGYSDGSHSANVSGDTHVSVKGKVIAKTYGGGKAEGKAGAAQADVDGTAYSVNPSMVEKPDTGFTQAGHTIYGGGNAMAGTYSAQADVGAVVLESGGPIYAIRGGGTAAGKDGVNAAADCGDISIRVEEGDVREIYGAGHATNADATANAASVTLVSTDTQAMIVYCGGTADGGVADVSGEISVDMTRPYLYGSFHGGGDASRGGSARVGDVDLKLTDSDIPAELQFGSVVSAAIYGGGEAAGEGSVATAGTVRMTVNGGSMAGNFLAGGSASSGGSADTGDSTITAGGFAGSTLNGADYYPCFYPKEEGNDVVPLQPQKATLVLCGDLTASELCYFDAIDLAGFRLEVRDLYTPDTEISDSSQGKTGVLDSKAVAQVGCFAYKDLTDAIEAAEDGGTVQVLKDIALEAPLDLTRAVTLEGVEHEGRRPVLTGAAGIISLTTDGVDVTLGGLELQLTANDRWAIYHSAGRLTVDRCAFTMVDGVTSTGNLIMGEGGAADGYTLIFTGNTVRANARAAVAGAGNNSVITDNEFDLVAPKWGGTDSRTSVLSLTADAKSGPITITGNTFRNANRAVAVDHAATLPGGKLVCQENRFFDVRYGFELGSVDNASCGQYELSKNYFVEGGTVSALRVEDANAAQSSHFDDTSLYRGSQVSVAPYYVRDALGDPTALNDYSGGGSSDGGGSGSGGGSAAKPDVDTETKDEGNVKTETVTESVKNKDGSTTTHVTEKAENAATGEKTESKVTATVAKDGSVTKEELKTTTAADGTKTEEKKVAISDKATGTETTARVVTDERGKTTATAKTEAKAETKVQKDGAATATVDEKTAEKLTEQAKAGAKAAEGADKVEASVVLSADLSAEEAKTVETVTVELTRVTVDTLAKETTADLVVSTPVANVTVPNAALTELADQKGDKLAIKTEKTAGGGVKVALAVGGAEVETVSGGLKASLPAEGATSGTVAVLVHADGTEEIIRKSVAADGTVVAPLDGSATIKLVDNGKRFPDTEGYWANEAVEFVTARNLFQGVGEDSFAPAQQMTRGMLVTVLNRLENEPVADGMLNFTDVSEDWYYAGAVAWAAEQGIVTGTGGGFEPEAPITRQQLAAIVYRYLDAQGADLDQQGDLSAYADGAMVDGWARDAVAYAIGAGLMGGRGDGVLDPCGPATRAEVALVFQRLVENMA